MNSPKVNSNKLKKRRSSSMMNLLEHKNLIEKDHVMTKTNVIRKNNLMRRNYRNELVVKNRNIDYANIFEKTPALNRINKPVLATVKQEDEKSVNMELNYDEENIKEHQNSRITNIKNKINTLKVNFKSIIGVKKGSNVLETVAKTEPVVSKINNENMKKISPLAEPTRSLNAEKINLQHKRLIQNNKVMRTFSSASNIKPKIPAVRKPLLPTFINTNSNIKTMRNSDSTDSLKNEERRFSKINGNLPNKPSFKLGMKIVYDDKHLFAAQSLDIKEIEAFNKLITKRKIANHNLGGSLNSLNTLRC